VTVESAFVSTTGASDAPYTVRLTETLVENDVLAKVCVSEMGEKDLAYEMDGEMSSLSTRKLAETHGVKCYYRGVTSRRRGAVTVHAGDV
jgi:3-polyprenyl-4-hydroxybenzoate decarboxylase